MSIGYHIHKEGRSMKDAINGELRRAQSHGIKMRAMQMFVMGPRNSKITVTSEDKEYMRGLSEEGYNIIVHGSYLDNPWGSKPAAALHFIREELKICGEIKANGFILHLARKPAEEIIEMVKRILEMKPAGVKLYLELNSYKAGENTYETPEKIARIFSKFTPPDEVGFCVDTAHLWAAGVDISTREKAAEWIDKYNKIGIQDTTIALNDQITQLGSGVDEHAPLTYGTIFSNNKDTPNKSGMEIFLRWSIDRNIPVIMERKDDKPKIKGEPKIKNIDSDLMVIYNMGYYREIGNKKKPE
jgi:endonuclease IV